MAQREWVEKDFYKELGVSSDAVAGRDQEGLPQAGSRAASRREPRQRRRPRSGSRPCPRRTACCPIRPSARSTTRPAGCSPAAASVGGSQRRRRRRLRPVRFGGDGAEFDLGDLFDAAGQTGGANIGDLFGGLFGRGAQHRARAGRVAATTSRPRPNSTSCEATKGVAMPLRLTSPAPCTNCHGSGARPGTSPQVCPTLQRRRGDQPQPGRVRVLRAVHRLPGQRLDHRAPVRRVQRHRRHHPHPHHQRARSHRASRTVSGSGWPARARPVCAARRRVTCTSPCTSGPTRCSAATATT